MDRQPPTVLSRRTLLKLGGAAVAAGAVGVSNRGPADAQTPKRGGIFRLRGEDALTGFDPHLTANQSRTMTNLSTSRRPSPGSFPGRPWSSSAI